jgi:hypothetical protein
MEVANFMFGDEALCGAVNECGVCKRKKEEEYVESTEQTGEAEIDDQQVRNRREFLPILNAQGRIYDERKRILPSRSFLTRIGMPNDCPFHKAHVFVVWAYLAANTLVYPINRTDIIPACPMIGDRGITRGADALGDGRQGVSIVGR